MYKLQISKQALKKFKLLLPSDRKKVLKALEKIESNPFDSNLQIKKLKGLKNEFFRIRLGDVRLVYTIGSNLVSVTKIDYRGSIY